MTSRRHRWTSIYGNWLLCPIAFPWCCSQLGCHVPSTHRSLNKPRMSSLSVPLSIAPQFKSLQKQDGSEYYLPSSSVLPPPKHNRGLENLFLFLHHYNPQCLSFTTLLMNFSSESGFRSQGASSLFAAEVYLFLYSCTLANFLDCFFHFLLFFSLQGRTQKALIWSTNTTEQYRTIDNSERVTFSI